MDANLELQKLKQRLLAAGYETEEVTAICSSVATEVGTQIADAVAQALSQAESAGAALGAQDFVAELGAVSVGDHFLVTTDSGQTDWSEPPFPMLPHLLKNAKTAKDGSRYQRIPIANKSVSTGTSSYDAIKDRQGQLDEAKAKLNESLSASTNNTTDMTAPAQSYVEAYKASRAPKRDKEYKRRAPGGTAEIRTASSKQNPDSQWVRPGKDFNMTTTLADINANLQSTINEIIEQAISRYGV